MSASPGPRVLRGAVPVMLRYGRAPIGVSWIVTNRCNLRCVYCGCPDVKTRELKTEQALDVIDELATLGTAQVHITGGEPLVRKDIDQLIQRLRYHAIRVTLTTNGTLVPRRIRSLRGCWQVSMSLDGPPSVHDQNRATGQVDEVLEALRLLKDEGIPRKLQCLVTRTTSAEAVDFVLETGAQYDAKVYFQPALEVILATEEPNPVVAQATKVRAIFEDLMRRRAAGAPVGNSPDALTHLSRWPEERQLHCPVNRVAVRLTPEGVLLPCHERADVPDGESVLEGGFRAAFGRLKLKSCTECWGSGRTEIRTSLLKSPAAVLKALSGA